MSRKLFRVASRLRANSTQLPVSKRLRGPAVPRQQLARMLGFTLLELMVVIVIVAILAGFVTINLDIRNTPKTIREQATRLGLLMQLASDQAIYSNQQLGIRFHPESYEFYLLAAGDDGESAWQILDDARLRFKPVNEKLVFKVDIAGIPIVLETLEEEMNALGEDDVIKPHVLFLSNGEIQPDYAIVVADEEERLRHRVFSGEEVLVEVEQLE